MSGLPLNVYFRPFAAVAIDENTRAPRLAKLVARSVAWRVNSVGVNAAFKTRSRSTSKYKNLNYSYVVPLLGYFLYPTFH